MRLSGADLAKDIKEMNLGTKTQLKEEGKRLSGGQKQRINIARNLYNLREVNIFDDTLSALDENTKNKVMENLLKIGKDTTMIFVSNSVNQMKKLDKIYVMENGQFQDEGTHEELMNRNTLYQELASFEKEGEEV